MASRVTVTPDQDLARLIKKRRLHGVQTAEQYRKIRENEIRTWFDAWNDGETKVELLGCRYVPTEDIVFALVTIAYEEGDKTIMFQMDRNLTTTEVWSHEAKARPKVGLTGGSYPSVT